MIKNILVSFILIFFVGCSVRVINHDEDMAAKSAIEWAKIALIQHDFQKAYSLSSDNLKKIGNFDQFNQVGLKIHPSLFPVSLVAKEYQNIPSKEAMYIYLFGENNGEQFYYRILMEGTENTGYKVGGFWRKPIPYPDSIYKKKFEKFLST